ncbi:fimbrial protein [Acinetobacter sp. WC-323]|uniref:fimbrial protein n=1 Tax=Acinetobacter sp. WC-323 TaxID=903918 RepID=UPI00029EA82A|nr:type 1 fimbrial protein [Acinetobacter sp. WC-323]EKU56495.1 fimbrial protein [Acinetobacter sp. WC-323]
MKKLSLGLALLAICATSTTFAATGVITFTGQLVAGTCSANVAGSGNASASVTLPTVNTAALGAANATAGTTAFKINLTGTGCTASGPSSSTLIATPYFESEVAKVNAAGRLINTGAATGVDVQLLTNNQTVIDVNAPAPTQSSSVGVSAGTNSNDFNYFARYFATAATTAGAVTSSVSYSIIYK